MGRGARQRALQRVADRVAERLRAARRTSGEDFRELEAEYRLVETGYHVWPFRPGAFGISAATAITLIVNVVALLYRLLSAS
jgi:hypothetical protein